MLPWKLWKRQILPVNQNLSSVYFSLAKFQLVSCNLSLAMIWQMTYTHKLPKLCSATLIKGNCEYTVCLKHFIKPFSCLHLTFEGLLSYLKAVNDNSTKSWSQGMNVYVRCNSIATHLSSGKYISKMLLLRMFLIYPIINCF